MLMMLKTFQILTYKLMKVNSWHIGEGNLLAWLFSYRVEQEHLPYALFSLLYLKDGTR